MTINDLKVGDTIQWNTGISCPYRIGMIRGIDWPYFDCADYQGHYRIHKELIKRKVIDMKMITEDIEQ